MYFLIMGNRSVDSSKAQDDLHTANIKQYVVKPDYTPESIIEGFRKVLDIGATFDDTINNFMTHLQLRR